LEKTAKESLSNHDPTESEILQRGYGILQMGRRDGFIAFAKPKTKTVMSVSPIFRKDSLSFVISQ
jgi:hypothetical protein